ncbi:MAG: neuA2 [Firmicutes bacterium]|nr:neuA2 [Bacillota bacterium]
MKGIAIITARGGSKRIPRKNIKLFCEKPIIEYSIEAALKSGCFDEVMVSTDDAEIAEISRSCGANVPFMRSIKNSDDFSTTADVLSEVISEYETRGKHFDYMACIYPTAPFVTAEKLKYAVEELKRTNALMLMPVVEFSYPPQRGYIIKDDKIEMKWKENLTKRSQDLEKIYHDCGQFYVYDMDGFKKNNGMIHDNIVPLFMNEMEVQDIDNESDWKLAEMKYRIGREQNGGC